MCYSLLCSVFITYAGRRHDDDAEAAIHPGGDGPRVDGEESIQREADGAAGGGPMDGNDQVDDVSSVTEVSIHRLFTAWATIGWIVCFYTDDLKECVTFIKI